MSAAVLTPSFFFRFHPSATIATLVATGGLSRQTALVEINVTLGNIEALTDELGAEVKKLRALSCVYAEEIARLNARFGEGDAG